MDPFLLAYTKDFDAILEHTRTELSQLRTGRASPAMVENLMVEVYGTKSAIKSLASISCPDPRTILIAPWDRSIFKDLERALGAHGMNAAADGDAVRVGLPVLTEEHRKTMVKTLKEKLELERVKSRQLRDKVRETIQRKTKEKELTEDDKHRLLKALDTEAGKFSQALDTLAQKKEQEIMTV